MKHKLISERAQILLKHLVEMYLRDGQPIGSKTLVNSALPMLSPATVRKVLGDLEELGYLTSPHTSAGRVPTTRGIRFFVDSLLSVHPLEVRALEKAALEIPPNESSINLITKTSALLSELTHMVGIVTLPQREQQILRHLEFLPLSDNRVLVILVLNEHEVQNRIIMTERTYTVKELNQAAQFLNQHFLGKDLIGTIWIV
jgi:heat-inducible transcriptional repressor